MKIFNTTQSDLIKYNGFNCSILRKLSEDECDIEEVGNMYRIRLNNGVELDAFEDELS